jgi:hypothetical protein
MTRRRLDEAELSWLLEALSTLDLLRYNWMTKGSKCQPRPNFRKYRILVLLALVLGTVVLPRGGSYNTKLRVPNQSASNWSLRFGLSSKSGPPVQGLRWMSRQLLRTRSCSFVDHLLNSKKVALRTEPAQLVYDQGCARPLSCSRGDAYEVHYQ